MLLLDVNGVGYEVEAPMSTFYTLPEVGAKATLFTHLAIREDAHVLYGFSNESERLLFRSLLKVSGVGAKMALAILSGMTAEEFRRWLNCRELVKKPQSVSLLKCATGWINWSCQPAACRRP
jgi:Holliday junction DNA helicase RuvA